MAARRTASTGWIWGRRGNSCYALFKLQFGQRRCVIWKLFLFPHFCFADSVFYQRELCRGGAAGFLTLDQATNCCGGVSSQMIGLKSQFKYQLQLFIFLPHSKHLGKLQFVNYKQFSCLSFSLLAFGLFPSPRLGFSHFWNSFNIFNSSFSKDQAQVYRCFISPKHPTIRNKSVE